MPSTEPKRPFKRSVPLWRPTTNLRGNPKQKRFLPYSYTTINQSTSGLDGGIGLLNRYPLLKTFNTTPDQLTKTQTTQSHGTNLQDLNIADTNAYTNIQNSNDKTDQTGQHNDKTDKTGQQNDKTDKTGQQNDKTDQTGQHEYDKIESKTNDKNNVESTQLIYDIEGNVVELPAYLPMVPERQIKADTGQILTVLSNGLTGLIKVHVFINSHPAFALFDTGNTTTLVDDRLRTNTCSFVKLDSQKFLCIWKKSIILYNVVRVYAKFPANYLDKTTRSSVPTTTAFPTTSANPTTKMTTAAKPSTTTEPTTTTEKPYSTTQLTTATEKALTTTEPIRPLNKH